MKTKLFLCLLALLSMTSIYAKNKKIKGNQNLTSTVISIDNFSSIEINDLIVNIDYEQSKSKSPYLKFEIDENLVNYISIKVENGILYINKNDKKVDLEFDKLNIYTNSTDLSSIKNTGVVTLNIKRPFAPKKFSLDNTGIGNLDITNITADEIYIESTGTGDITIEGITNLLSIKSSGKTTFNEDNLKAKSVDIESSGMDEISVWATDSINAEANGMSKIRYKGNPTYKQISKSGFSSIKAIK